MKLITWNIEWMNKWFQGNSSPDWGSSSLSAGEARIAAQKTANVINAMQADLLCIQEGPSHINEMMLFIDTFLSDATGNALYEPLIGPDGRQQKMYALRRIGGKVTSIDYAIDLATEALLDEWEADVDGNMHLEAYDFTRVPLVVDAALPGGRNLRVIVLHTKSKYVHGGEARWSNPARRQEFIVDALKARRRISAEGFRLRTYLDDLLQDQQDRPFAVLGDFNDGPGRDFFERSYLTHNVTDIVLGSTFYPNLILHHPLIGTIPPPSLYTARFDDYVDDIQDRPLLLDHILVSPRLAGSIKAADIAHVEFEAELEGSGSQRTQRASDHRPVWIELDDQF